MALLRSLLLASSYALLSSAQADVGTNTGVGGNPGNVSSPTPPGSTSASPPAAQPANTPAPPETTETVEVTAPQPATATHAGDGRTVVPAKAIEQQPGPTELNNIIAAMVPGAAALPNEAIRVRGSDNQYSYYLDGAPLPANVSALITDQINPKNIETLRILTGAFPAEYGGQLAAVFDITAKAGRADAPGGYIQQSAGNFNTYDTAAQYGGGVKNFSYFVSGFRSRSDFRLNPITATPLHNGGSENVGFAKLDYQLRPHDKLTLHLGSQDAALQVPNSPDRQAVGQDDNQLENKQFVNFIWQHGEGPRMFRLALYSHSSRARYRGSAQDLLSSPDSDSLALKDDDDDSPIEVKQTQRINDTGVRGDYTLVAGKNHQTQLGFETSRARGQLNFTLLSPAASGLGPLVDDRPLVGSDSGIYAQDDWKIGRFALNYGARYDVHQAETKSSQLSPRVNLSYAASQHDTLYAFYNRLFMPVPVESIREFAGNNALGDLSGSAVQPERDNYYGLGLKHQVGRTTFTVDAYAKFIKNIVDNQEIGDTLIEVPINEAKGVIRGVEFAVDHKITPDLTFYGSYALSRGLASGPVVGGLLGLEDLPPGYFLDDHDESRIAAFNLAYNRQQTFALLTGQYATGLPFGEIDAANGDPLAINFNRAPSHFILNLGVGHKFHHGLQIALNMNNLLNRNYVIIQDNVFRRPVYGQRRMVGVKATLNF